MSINRCTRSLLLVLVLLAVSAISNAGVILSIGIAPPPLPVYDQPLCPAEGYIWTPGYWAYSSDAGYFWVPGAWVMVPEPGLLWTPGYWGWGDGVFVFHEGYWGPHVGFYGGINYGFGYVGDGYAGGYWNNGAFFYNRSVNNVERVTNVYSKTVIVNNITVNHVSYNGGQGGITARPTRQEEAAAHERHVPPTHVQTTHVQAASTNRQLFESQNHGKPAIAATAKPGEFSGRNAVAAKAAAPSYKPVTARTVSRTAGNPTPRVPANATPRTPEKNATQHSNTAVRSNDVRPARQTAPSTAKPQVEQRHQQPTPERHPSAQPKPEGKQQRPPAREESKPPKEKK